MTVAADTDLMPPRAVDPAEASWIADVRAGAAVMRDAGGMLVPLACLLEAEADDIAVRGLVYGRSLAALELAQFFTAGRPRS